MANTKPHIIVVDDEPDLRAMVGEYLEEQGFDVSMAKDGAELRALLKKRLADLVVLDVNMPGEDGLSIARYLREHYTIGIVMLTAAGAVVDRIVGLEVGADDYLAKPFDPRELLARIKSVLRRLPQAKAEEKIDTGRSANVVRFGKCLLNLESHTLATLEGEDMPITSMEFDLLKAFATHPDRVLNRDQLLNLAHDRDWDPYDRSIDIRIARLRRKVEYDPSKPEAIKTVRGAGYIFKPAPLPAVARVSETRAAEAELEQEIHSCTTVDGVRIAYALVGSGTPIVKAANWLNHLEYDWRSPVWRHWLRELAKDHRLVRYDERGNGLSDWEVEDISFEAFVRDLETVVDDAGLERFSLLGISQGCAVSVAYAVRHPERVSHLVLYGGYARGWRRRGSRTEVERGEALLTLMRQGWGQDNPAFRQVFTSLFIPEATPEQAQWYNDLQRITTSPEMAIRIRSAFGEIDVSALLPQVRAPTLVLHCHNDAVAPFDQGRALASGIPGARFVALEGRNHLILEHEPAWKRFLAELRAFLGTPDSE